MRAVPADTPGALPLALSGVCGAAMAAAAGFGAHGVAAIAALAAVGAVLAGLWWRAVSTAAVLFAVVAIGLADPPTVSAAVAGLAAVAYLLLRHAGEGTATVTAPALLGAAGFSIVGVLAAGFPWQLPWTSVAAAPAALGCYLLALRSYPARRS